MLLIVLHSVSGWLVPAHGRIPSRAGVKNTGVLSLPVFLALNGAFRGLWAVSLGEM